MRTWACMMLAALPVALALGACSKNDTGDGGQTTTTPGTPADCAPACAAVYGCGYCMQVSATACFAQSECVSNCEQHPDRANCVRNVTGCNLDAFVGCYWSVFDPGAGGAAGSGGSGGTAGSGGGG